MKILIYGGTFDPPHLGHKEALKAAVKVIKPDKTLVIPGRMMPHKQNLREHPAPEERFAMAQLTFSDIKGVEISDLEMQRSGYSYTADTLLEIKIIYPKASLYLLMGTDMFLSLETWNRAEEVFSLCTPTVLSRNEGDNKAISEKTVRYLEKYGVTTALVKKTPYPVSSTEVRNLLPQRGGRKLLTPEVYAYIIRNRFYDAKPELSWLREQAFVYLKPSRVLHVLGCEEMAVRLAERWGIDAESAAEAAILHDITKKMPVDEQLRMCDKYGIIIDTLEKESPELLHSKTGAAFAREQFGIPEEIYNAIFWHTTGKPDMTTLEKIIYLADSIEERTRSYPGVEDIRICAFKDLDEAIVMSLRSGVESLQKKGVNPHPRSLEAMNWILQNRK